MMVPAITDRLTDLRLALAAARATSAQGGTIDLLGLDDEIANLLAEARLAPATERGAILFAVEALLAELHGVALELNRHRDAVLVRRATGAYGGGGAAP